MLPLPLAVVVFASFVVSKRKPSLLFRDSESYLFCKIIDGDDDGELSNLVSLQDYQERRESYGRKVAKRLLRRPPNPLLGPVDFVKELLRELCRPHHSQSKCICLLESSTEAWRRVLCGSVGAFQNAANREVGASLEVLFRRPDNQFGVLVGTEDEGYALDFPSDFVDYNDGTCWVECRIRSAADGELLVVTGWSLLQRSSDGA